MYCSALVLVLHVGIATAVGEALDAVMFATTVFAACAASAVAVTLPQAGAVLDPVETMACPADEPAGLINWTGIVVAAIAATELSAASAPVRIRFI